MKWPHFISHCVLSFESVSLTGYKKWITYDVNVFFKKCGFVTNTVKGHQTQAYLKGVMCTGV